MLTIELHVAEEKRQNESWCCRLESRRDHLSLSPVKAVSLPNTGDEIHSLCYLCWFNDCHFPCILLFYSILSTLVYQLTSSTHGWRALSFAVGEHDNRECLPGLQCKWYRLSSWWGWCRASLEIFMTHSSSNNTRELSFPSDSWWTLHSEFSGTNTCLRIWRFLAPKMIGGNRHEESLLIALDTIVIECLPIWVLSSKRSDLWCSHDSKKETVCTNNHTSSLSRCLLSLQWWLWVDISRKTTRLPKILGMLCLDS
jgi:hypothetical protein